MSGRRKRVQVGWYCDHEDEPHGSRTHMAYHGKWKRNKWVETYAEPNTLRALTFLDYKEPKKRPHCPRAEPIYVYRSTDAAQD